MWPVVRKRGNDSVPLTNELRFLLTGQGLSALGDRLQDLALPLWVFAVTGSAVQMGLVFAIGILPVIVLGPWAGWVVDRFDRRFLLVITEFSCAAVLGGLLVAVHYGSMVGIYLAVAAAKVFNSVSLPAVQAVIKDAPSPTIVGRATATAGAIAGVASAIGPLVGGAMLAAFGPIPVVIANIASFVASGICCCLLAPHPGSRDLPRPVAANRQVVQLLLGSPPLRRIVGVDIGYFLLSGGIGILGMLIVEESLGSNAAGLFVAALGVGWILGSLVARRRPRRALANLRIVAFAMGPLAVAMATLASVPLAVPFIGIADGAVNALAAISAVLVYQQESAAENIGRVFAVRRMITNSCLGMSYVLLPLVANLLGRQATILASGAMTMAVLFVVLSVGRLRRDRDALGDRVTTAPGTAPVEGDPA